MIHLLLEKDSSLTREKSLSGRTVIHFAAIYGNDEAISYYLSNTFLSINAQDNEGSTPLHYAVEKKYNSTINLLIESGAKTDIKNNELSFSYQLREGIAQNMNACFLMQKMGITV